MENGVCQTPRWARKTVTRVNGIPVLGLKRALAEEAENCVAARGKKEWRKSLLAVRQICDLLIEATTGQRHPIAVDDVPADPTREYVRQEIAALPEIVASMGEGERVRALMRGRLVTERALQALIGFLVAAGCPLCNQPFLDNMTDGIGPTPEIGAMIAKLLCGSGLIS